MINETMQGVTLLSLGIFASVRPQVKPALPTEAPAFLLDDQHVRAVSPFAVIEFVVSERQLPSIEAFSVRLDASVDRPRLRGTQCSAGALAGALAGAWHGGSCHVVNHVCIVKATHRYQCTYTHTLTPHSPAGVAARGRRCSCTRRGGGCRHAGQRGRRCRGGPGGCQRGCRGNGAVQHGAAADAGAWLYPGFLC